MNIKIKCYCSFQDLHNADLFHNPKHILSYFTLTTVMQTFQASDFINPKLMLKTALQ